MKKLLAGLALGALAMVGTAHAQSESFPSQPIKFIVPLGPGSGADTNTRALADRIQKAAGVPAIVENRPGADLIIGTSSALNAPPDGHTVFMITPSAVVINPLFIKDLPYDPKKIRPILHLTNNVGVLVTAADSRFNTLQDVLDEARKQPKSVSIGLYGNTYRLGAQALSRAAGVEFNDIPYKGFGQTINDVIGGMTETALVDLGGALPLIESGKLKALAVGSDKRLDVAPNIPTVSESGFPGYSLYIFVGYAVHADTPEPVFKKLEAMLQQVASAPELKTLLTQHAGTYFVGNPGKPFADFIDNEVKKAREAMAAGQ
nr:tripartite tricarboxylate transporter substrate binding protein [Pseudomonas sp.]